MVSAVKVGGERLYMKARRGEEVERAARTVAIHALELRRFDPGAQTARLEVVCSGGTYVRTLIHDLGQALGVGAHMTALRRTDTGGFTLDDAISLDEVDVGALLPLHAVVRSLPVVKLDVTSATDVSHGRSLDAELAPDLQNDAVAALTFEDELVAVYRRAGNKLVPDRVVSQ